MKIIYVKRIKWTHLLQLRRAGYTVILKAFAPLFNVDQMKGTEQ